MPDYTVYGGVLRSAIDLPELGPAAGEDVRWTYHQAAGGAPAEDLQALGSEPIYGTVYARLFRRPSGYRITIDDTGSFDLSHDGAIIHGYPLEEAWPDFVRAHLIGRVLATALHLQGVLTLHGSAVVVGQQAVAFLAPKHFGKTTLALSLTQAGCTLLTDDTLPIDVPGGTAYAGVHRMRMQPDTAARLAGDGARPLTRDGKEVLQHLHGEWEHRDHAPLEALYLLIPAEEIADGTSVSRRLLPGGSSAVSLVAHAKIGEMLGAWGAPAVLEWAATLARSVPVYQLAVVRDLDVLPEVVTTLGHWHGADLTWESRAKET